VSGLLTRYGMWVRRTVTRVDGDWPLDRSDWRYIIVITVMVLVVLIALIKGLIT